MDDTRQYSNDEIQDIFRRAAERQQAAQGKDGGTGLTLEELQQIAEESGLDPAHVEAAAREVSSGRAEAAGAVEKASAPRGVERFYRTTSKKHIERVLPGTMSDETWDDMVEVLEAVFQNAGKATTAGPIREWHLASSLSFDRRIFESGPTVNDWLQIFDSMSQPTRGPVTVEVRPEGSGTRVEMSYAMPSGRLWEGPGLVMLFGAIALLTGGISLAVGEPMVLIATFIMLVMSVWLGTYTYMSHRAEISQTHERMQKAMDRIQHLQAARTDGGEYAMDERPATEENGVSAPLLDDQETGTLEDRASGANRGPRNRARS
ncbi:MAG: hypothetical protein GVY25_05185 [Bacteroidetes bacterium]|nr:hypothetical protein [Bacteroidota bacterium]